jgi:hypothetical protein
MAIFPTLEQGGPAYRVQLWSPNAGNLGFVVGCPESPDVTGPAFEGRLWDFAAALAADFDVSITGISKFSTSSTQLEMPVT